MKIRYRIDYTAAALKHFAKFKIALVVRSIEDIHFILDTLKILQEDYEESINQDFIDRKYVDLAIILNDKHGGWNSKESLQGQAFRIITFKDLEEYAAIQEKQGNTTILEDRGSEE